MSEFDQDDSESAVYVEVKDVSFDDGESPTIFQKLPGSAVATTQNEDDIGITKAPGPHALSTLNDTTITSEKDERFQITTPSHPIFPGAFLPPVDDSQDGGPLRRKTASDPTTYDQSAMETMNLPFAQTLAQLQQKSYTHHEGDADNLSIVSNASRIPTYMGFHQRRGRNFRKLVQEKAKPVAKQTVERCRQVAEKLLAEWREPKGMKCVPVGEEL
ncbi:hypothetical protein N0V88_004462 [Collariella sp. IMI 366227]|nr:hypothetical protein N0V88_004462 [Collariella sp. IMI 366227]